MGVTGLWPILAPSARPTPLPTLNRKRLAVDASIWIYQFLKAVRDKEGNALRNSHVVGFFRRICKLLYFGIKPVFVFDGGAPALKRQTILGRKQRREGRREDAARTAGRLLAVQMKRRGEEEEAKRKKDREREAMGFSVVQEDEDVITNDQELVYVSEMGMSAQERQQNRKFRKTDAYHLPELTNGIEGMGKPDDPRIMSADELEEYARQFNDGEDVNMYDFSKIDFNGEFFMSLPAGDRYNILNAARLRSRLRMGLSKEQLEDMFPDRMAFSRFQIDRVRERNELTQRLMNLNGMNADLVGVDGGRIAGETGREYVLVKNDGVEGGWALGVVSTDKGVGERNKPIDVEALTKKVKKHEESEEDDEFEDVPVEGLNRLPSMKTASGKNQNMTYEDYKTSEMADQRKKFYESRNKTAPNRGERSTPAKIPSPEADSLFVDDGQSAGLSVHRDFDTDEDENLRRAIAMSMQTEDTRDNENHTTGATASSIREDGSGMSDDEDHLNRAIALSMQAHHRLDVESDEDNGDFEDVPMPEYEQKAVQPSKPIFSSSGGMIAHIVNNRANAALPKGKPKAANIDSDSESDMDLQSVLAKARKQKAPVERRREPAPVANNVKNPFDGPLPFERLDFGTSIFGKGKGKMPQNIDKAVEERVDEENQPGGFDIELQDDAPKPIPPWLAGGDDIRSQVDIQKRRDEELNAEDREMAEEDARRYEKEHAPIEIESSDEESDVEILDQPPRRQERMGDIAEEVRAIPPSFDLPGGWQPARDLDAGPSEDVIEVTSLVSNSKETSSVEDEEIEWSESDYGDSASKPLKTVTPPARVRSASPEFEDVEISETTSKRSQQTAKMPTPQRESSPLFENVNMSDSAAAFLPAPSQPRQYQTEESYEQQRAEDAEFDDFSDPEDQELLAQLAIEAEEHARFASTLNNKSEQENQEAYEKELKALRSQQKKDRRDADEVSHIMITECQALLRLFGLPYITAPMEAEAQCAELVRLGLVDGVVTDDCDIFLFGGTRVYKNMFNSNKFVECYLSNDIEKDLSLTREQLISIAHLLGSDYTEGLPGVGPVTALEIISEFPTAQGLQDFKEWWAEVQQHPGAKNIETNKFRKKFRRAQGSKLFLSPMFPSDAVTEAYLKPAVDSTPEPFQWGVPDLDQLREFLMATIGWTQERTDEVLVPVIRDMNRRETEGTQANITRYFEGAVGAGARGLVGGDSGGGGGVGSNATVGSKRMKEAVGKLKAKKGGKTKDNPLARTFGEEAQEWAKNNDLSWTEREQAKLKTGKGRAKAKGRKRTAIVVEEDEDENVDVQLDGENEGLEIDGEGEGEADDDSGSAEDYAQAKLRGNAKGKAKERGELPASTRRKRAKV